MSRIPENEMQKHKDSRLKGYEAIWFHILKSKDKEFTVQDICLQTNSREDSVRDYIKRLVRAEFVEKLENKKGTDPRYRKNIYIVLKPVYIAPQITRKGTMTKLGTGRDQMWRTMKMLGRFTKHDLSIHASTKECQVKLYTAQDYIKHMVKAGYIVCSKKTPQNVANEYVFLQSKNTGPKAPIIQRVKDVYDPNIKQIVWSNRESGNE